VSVLDVSHTRRELLVAGTGAAAMTLAGSAVAGSAAAGAASPAAALGADRLRRLLSAELLIVYCYEHVLDSQILDPHERQALAPLKTQEEAHVHALRARLAALGAPAPPSPASVTQADHDLSNRMVRGRLGQLKGSSDALRLLLAVERVVVGAYFVALTKLADPSLVTLSAQIMANDAQHEAIIGELLYAGNAQKAVPYGLVQGTQ
jgi:ferritin-like protein